MIANGHETIDPVTGRCVGPNDVMPDPNRAAYETAFEKGRALGMDHGEAHDYAKAVTSHGKR